MQQFASYHPLYYTWFNMRARCNNPKHLNYKYYGARGIKVCKRWDNFANFVSDIGERPKGYTLDRTDNAKGYSPKNCRWATKTEQAFNRRRRSDNTSGHTGVRWDKPNRKWMVTYRHKTIGRYSSKSEAIKIRVALEG